MNTINSTQRSTEGQCIELLMQLRRSLTQQHDVRLAVYEVENSKIDFHWKIILDIS